MRRQGLTCRGGARSSNDGMGKASLLHLQRNLGSLWGPTPPAVGLRGRMGVALVSLGLVGSVSSPPDRTKRASFGRTRGGGVGRELVESVGSPRVRQHGGRGGGAVGVKQGRGAYAAPAYASVLCGALRVRMEGATYPGRTEHPRGRALAQRFSRHAKDVFSAAGRRADADPRDAAGAGDAAGIALE